jgi:hypothetical protein
MNAMILTTGRPTAAHQRREIPTLGDGRGSFLAGWPLAGGTTA